MPDDYKKEMDALLEEVIKRDATDLHLSVGRPPIFRIDGSLNIMEGREPMSPEHARDLIMSLMNKEQLAKFEANKDVDLSITYQDKARFRANIYQESNNIAAALRFIPSRIRTIEDFSLPPILHQFTQVPQGFFLVVGPSGHGKSTALAAMVDEINHSRRDHLITIEDPIEYIFPQDKCIIDQREVS